MASSLEARVVEALAAIRNPRLDNDLLSAGMIRDLSVTDAGGVELHVPARPGGSCDARAAGQGCRPGHRRCTARRDQDHGHQSRRSRPHHSSAAVHPRRRRPPAAAPTPAEQPNLGRIIAVSSGKGGVGKSTVAVNLAVALAQAGASVGVMDADIYGPNIPRMFGVFEKPPVIGGKIQPLEAHGVKLMSLGFLVERDAPAIWRGPIIMKIVTQFLQRRGLGRARLLPRRPAARHRRRAALAGAGHAGVAARSSSPRRRRWPWATRSAAPRCSSAWACR